MSGIACKSETLRSLYSHALLALTGSSMSRESYRARTNAIKKIPQQAGARLAQWDEHSILEPVIIRSIPPGGNLPL